MSRGDIVKLIDPSAKTRGIVMEVDLVIEKAWIWWLNVPRYNYEEIELKNLEVIK